ncbi:Putative mycotoxin biosynthesis protein UstYa [Septoria linicola]|uniref:Mycotoxin biosynthesis protein UstYa n=1 Tax=Septoria linicola TaxID=215465 RepID=A0A9Q9B5M8_9PEZI|nr:Putative mycotoxin biosynthesis protein UstYa [Septoria linicola]
MSSTPLMKNEARVSDDDYSDAGQITLSQRRKQLLRKENIGWAFLFATLLAVTIGLSAGVAVAIVLSWQKKGPLFSQSFAPSPVTRDLDVAFHETRFDGSFMEENVYRRKANNETDAAWMALGVGYRSVLIPADVAPSVGLRPEQVQVSDKYGGGFPANVEGLHQLHCLNLVRQSLYYNIDYYRAKGEGAFVNEEPVVQKHVSHCLDIIRQQLMCQVDIGVLGQVWWQPKNQKMPEAFVDFNTKHVCKNFDAIRQWAEERQMPMEVPDDYLQGPRAGDTVLDHIP